MGYPDLVVADRGHSNGARMRDFGAFADPASPRTAMLVECGQHWARGSVEVAIATCRRFLEAARGGRAGAAGSIVPAARDGRRSAWSRSRTPITVNGGPFRFTQDFQGLEVVPDGRHDHRLRRHDADPDAL